MNQYVQLYKCDGAKVHFFIVIVYYCNALFIQYFSYFMQKEFCSIHICAVNVKTSDTDHNKIQKSGPVGECVW